MGTNTTSAALNGGIATVTLDAQTRLLLDIAGEESPPGDITHYIAQFLVIGLDDLAQTPPEQLELEQQAEQVTFGTLSFDHPAPEAATLSTALVTSPDGNTQELTEADVLGLVMRGVVVALTEGITHEATHGAPNEHSDTDNKN